MNLGAVMQSEDAYVISTLFLACIQSKCFTHNLHAFNLLRLAYIEVRGQNSKGVVFPLGQASFSSPARASP